MFKPVRLIDVMIEPHKIGRLLLVPEGYTLFEYNKEWLQMGFSISPFYLPLKAGVFAARKNPFDGLFGVFNDSLPDGWGRLLTDRWLKNQRINPLELTVLDRLSLVGKNGMGALTFHPEFNFKSASLTHDLDFYADEVRKILNEENSDSFEEIVRNAGSSGGARPKVLVHLDGNDWLVKFQASSDPVDVGEIEYKTSLLAKKCGIDMPETRLFRNRYFGTRRFDLEETRRKHVHSASGLLYASYRLPSLDYSGLMQATLALTRNMKEVEKMFRLMVFNVAIGNKDDHAKNFSFIYENNAWILAPAYDLLPSSGFNGHHTTTVNGKGNPEITDCLEVARLTAFPLKKAKEIIEEIRDEVG
jgi:serine/threonine-protein kinase HipA